MIMGACALFLTSCGTVKSYNFTTGGMRGTDSSYLITASGRHVDAAHIDVKPGKVIVDGKPYRLDSISSIRSKQMYFGVKDGKILLGESLGKINILYQKFSVPTYGSPYGSVPGSASYNTMVTGHTTEKRFYIQKAGSLVIDKMTPGIVVDYVSDNDEALQVAIGARNWKRGYWASWAGLGVGSFLGFKSVFSTETDASGSIKPVNFTPTLIILVPSVLGATLTSYMYNTRMMKAVEIYNR